MKYSKFFPIIIILIIFLAGVGLWQAKLLQGPKTVPSSQTTTQVNTRNTNTIAISTSFIEQLRQRDFTGEEIKIEETISNNSQYATYRISYSSDDLKIYGVMKMPNGNGSFPVIILNHGYYNPSTFQSGNGTDNMGNILASKGYITIASDYRGHGQSEDTTENSRGHRPEYAIDVLNLIASVKSIKNADENKIGIWGHSMGGEVSLRVAEATDKLKAVVLWAPTTGNRSDHGSAFRGFQSPTTVPSTDGSNPLDFLKYISTPVSLHQGLSDTEVKPEVSKNLSEVLKKEGKQVEYFEYESQDHNFQNLGWDLISQRTLTFYNKHLK